MVYRHRGKPYTIRRDRACPYPPVDGRTGRSASATDIRTGASPVPTRETVPTFRAIQFTDQLRPALGPGYP